MENLTPYKHAVISWIIMAAGFLVTIIGGEISPDLDDLSCLVYIGIIVVIIGIVWHLIFVRCPYCGRPLSGYRPLPKICPDCGRNVEETEE